MATACGGGDSSSPNGGATAASGPLCIVSIDEGVFSYCAEYVGFTASQCAQGKGMFNAQCPGGYVGTCSTDANVNPRRTYFYGTALAQQAVASVCPGGKYVPGTIPGAGGAGGQGGNSGGATGGAGGGTSNGTCADLAQCCAATTDPNKKSTCQTEYDLLKAAGDSTCGYAVNTLRAGGYCK